jgi:hypothetical protein
MTNKQVNGFAAIPLLFLLIAFMFALVYLKEALKPVPVAPAMYKAGECGKNSASLDSDSIQTNDGVVFKILAVGKKNYELLTGLYDGKTVRVRLGKQSIVTLDPDTQKVDCPKELNDPKTLEKARDN